jgi:hypothetical protein
MLPGERLWTPEEDDLLKLEVAAGTPLDPMVTKIGRTKAAIRNRAYILRLKLGRPRASSPLHRATPTVRSS